MVRGSRGCLPSAMTRGAGQQWEYPPESPTSAPHHVPRAKLIPRRRRLGRLRNCGKRLEQQDHPYRDDRRESSIHVTPPCQNRSLFLRLDAIRRPRLIADKRTANKGGRPGKGGLASAAPAVVTPLRPKRPGTQYGVLRTENDLLGTWCSEPSARFLELRIRKRSASAPPSGVSMFVIPEHTFENGERCRRALRAVFV
jgi:hypothetical protein